MDARVTFGMAGLAVALLAALAASPARADGDAIVARVEPSYVCMMNDKRFAEPQIPVEVEGRTYYGCCEMCKERLTHDAAARTAVDPVSRNQVDKASAVIGAAPNGHVFYFENELNLAAFAAGTARP